MTEKQLFDDWPERYNQWFATPIGKLVKETEQGLVNELLDPGPGETILDAGCGTGVFTLDFLETGARVTGLDISRNMLRAAMKAAAAYPFSAIEGDMLYLPFRGNSFDKTVSVTAIEFIADAQKAVDEMFRVTRPGGLVVVATLNSLSPWAVRRDAKGEKHILEDAYYRSPADLLELSTLEGTAKTVVYFQKDDDPAEAEKIEEAGRSKGLDTGAFVAVRWTKPVK